MATYCTVSITCIYILSLTHQLLSQGELTAYNTNITKFKSLTKIHTQLQTGYQNPHLNLSSLSITVSFLPALTRKRELESQNG
jgi:hypothetical protein